ncbi:radical SAM protein, partial [candidate division KSB1 bacterium]|nr:radical SAM protein [candidate division KSB1 bacterium]
MIERLHSTLPIYYFSLRSHDVVYVPGQMLLTTKKERVALSRYWYEGEPEHGIVQLAERLQNRAQDVLQRWRKHFEKPFSPECVTIYLSNRCNLACPYCYATAGLESSAALPVISLPIVEKAVSYAAEACAAAGRPLYLALHGGGEPTVHWRLLQQILASSRVMTGKVGVDLHTYIATNGVLSAEKARWLAKNFDQIGLSCDGPPAIQNRQRPQSDGSETAALVERTAAILNQAGKRLEIRATITPESLARMDDVVRYAREKLGAVSLRFEPVYAVRNRNHSAFRVEQAEEFVGRFLSAQKLGRELSCEVKYSG